ncbi:MAG: ATP-binding protein [gamma proteobacterium symbiont of Taylorina sp.]|nr:ATP-binding protein [gamma proteobacterium symbiont of Taylorina sp.]
MNNPVFSGLLEINSCLESVPQVNTLLSLFFKQHHIDENTCFQLELCAVEAVNNAIIHAYANKPGGKITIEYSLFHKQLEIKISDSGAAMQQAIPEHLVAPESEGGRGWYIMKQWMDSVEYMSKQGTNTVILRKTL